MATTRRDNEKAAKGLVELALGSSVGQVAARHDVSARTVRRWRSELGKDAELSAAVAAHIRLAKRADWGEQLQRTHSKALEMLCKQLLALEGDDSVALPEKMALTLSVVDTLGEMQIAREVLGAGTEENKETAIPAATSSADATGEALRTVN